MYMCMKTKTQLYFHYKGRAIHLRLKIQSFNFLAIVCDGLMSDIVRNPKGYFRKLDSELNLNYRKFSVVGVFVLFNFLRFLL